MKTTPGTEIDLLVVGGLFQREAGHFIAARTAEE
jgi:hypothetical protein